MPLEVLWITAGVGWGLAVGYMVGHRIGVRQTPAEMRSLVREIDDELDKLVHQRDRIRKRPTPAAATADVQPVPGGEALAGDHRKSAIRRRAIEQGIFGLRTRGNGVVTRDAQG